MKILKGLSLGISFWLLIAAIPTWGQPANFTLDFESGDLRGWQKTGHAFDHQPTLSDNPTARHQGRYWIGTYEKYQGHAGQKPGQVQGDRPTGRLTSAPFTISHDYLKFLVGGGSGRATRVELLVLDPIEQTYVPRKWVSGQNTETMHPVVWDISQFRGKKAKLRIVDDSSGGWGHINVDDFRFEDQKASQNPSVKLKLVPFFQPVKKAPSRGLIKRVPPRSYKFRIMTDRDRITTAETLIFSGRLYPSNHRARYRFYWGDGQRSALLERPHINRRFEREGQFEIFAEAYIGNRVIKSNRIRISVRREHYEILLDPHPRQVFVGRTVIFTARMATPHREIQYLFVFGDHQKQKTAYRSQTEHRYSAPGTYYAQVIAILDNKQVAASSKVPVTVRIQPPAFTAKVSPGKVTVQKGEVVRFDGTTLPASVENLAMRWTGPGGRKESGPYFNVDTTFLKPGLYKVIFRVTDRFQRSARAYAKLKVIEKRFARLVLKSESSQVKLNRNVFLRAMLEPPITGVQYRFIFGDNQASTWSRRAVARHQYARQGSYRVKALARGEDIGTIESAALIIKVERSNLVFWIAIISGFLLAGSYGLYRLKKGTQKAPKSTGRVHRVKIRAIQDPGIQQVVFREERKIGTIIRMRLIKDPGDQKISGTILPTGDEKGEKKS